MPDRSQQVAKIANFGYACWVKISPVFLLLSACFALPPSFTGKGTVAPSGLFGLSAIEGLSSLGNTYIRDKLLLRGEGFDGLSQVQLFDAAGALVTTLPILSQTTTQAEVSLDTAAAAAIEMTTGVLTLRVSHQTLGSASRDVTLLRGVAGPRGPSGPPANITGSEFISVTGSQISLKQSACADGKVLKVVGGAWTCATDDVNMANAGVASVTQGAGMSVTGTSNVTAAVVFGSTNVTAARGDHDHFGATWSGSTTGAALTVNNTITDANQQTAAIFAQAAVSQNGGFTRATIRATNVATNNGVGVIGDSSGPGARGVVGVASGTGHAAGVFGYANESSPQAYGVWGVADNIVGVGVHAEHALASGTALKVDGLADFSGGAAVWPLKFSTSAQTTGGIGLVCDAGYRVISGGCFGTTAILLSLTYNSSTGFCTSTTFSAGTGIPNAYCCQVDSASFVTTEAVCLRAQ